MQSYYQNKTMLGFLHSPLKCTEEGKHTHSFCTSKTAMTPVRKKPQTKPLLISLARGSGALNFFITSITVTIYATLLLSVGP